MPLTYQQWDKDVSALGERHVARIKLVAKPFFEHPDATNARAVRAAYVGWLPSYWSFWDSPGAGGAAIRELYFRAVEIVDRSAIHRLGNQAINVLTRYGAYIDREYAAALRDVFVNPMGCPVTNFCVHERDDTFQSKFSRVVPGMASAARFVNGFTYPLTRRDETFPARHGDRIPASRVIELKPSYDDGTAFHELLHWVTHDEFENEAAQYTSEQFRIIEGVTEFFTRKIRSEHRSYESELATITTAVEPATGSPIIKLDTLAMAYFSGVNAKSVVSALATLASIANDDQEVENRRVAGKAIADQIHRINRWEAKLRQNRSDWKPELLTYLEHTPLADVQKQYGWNDDFRDRLKAKLLSFGINSR